MWEESITTKPQFVYNNDYTNTPQANKKGKARGMGTIIYMETYRKGETKKTHNKKYKYTKKNK